MEGLIMLKQLVAIVASKEMLKIMTEKMTCSPAEAEWLIFSLQAGSQGQEAALRAICEKNGIELPETVDPKKQLEFDEAVNLASSLLLGLVSAEKVANESMKKGRELHEKAFGPKQSFEREVEIFKEFFALAKIIDPSDIADSLFQRHLKLLN